MRVQNVDKIELEIVIMYPHIIQPIFASDSIFIYP